MILKRLCLKHSINEREGKNCTNCEYTRIKFITCNLEREEEGPFFEKRRQKVDFGMFSNRMIVKKRFGLANIMVQERNKRPRRHR